MNDIIREQLRDQLDQHVERIIDVVRDPAVYAKANTAIARERARQAPDGLRGGLELPCFIQDRIRSWGR